MLPDPEDNDESYQYEEEHDVPLDSNDTDDSDNDDDSDDGDDESDDDNLGLTIRDNIELLETISNMDQVPQTTIPLLLEYHEIDEPDENNSI